VVLRSCKAGPQTWYALSIARETRRGELARVHGARHRIEERQEEGKQEVGQLHYEVRSWGCTTMTLSLLALWFCSWNGCVWGETTAVTTSQVRQVFTELLKDTRARARRGWRLR